MDKSPCLLEKYAITIWLFKIATDNGTFTHDLYDDLSIENGDLLIYDELFIKYSKKNLTCCRCPLPSPLLLMPLRATSHSKSWFARFNRSVARCQEVALIPNCLVNSLVSSILARKTGILLQFVRSTISGHFTTNPSTLDDGPTAVSLRQQA